MSSTTASSSTERIRPVSPSPADTPPRAIPTSSTIDEGSCLLRSYSLPTITERDGGVVFLRYSLGRWHTVRIERGDMNDDDDDEVADEDEDTFRIVPLKDMYNGGRMEIKPGNFPSGEADGIRVVKFTECSIKIVEDFLKAISEFMRIPDTTRHPEHSQDPQPLLDSPNLTKYPSYVLGKDFVAGISLRAAFKPRKYLTLFAAFPYLGMGTSNGTGSLSLLQYHNLGMGKPDVDLLDPNKMKILVNQGWFFIFDNSNIAMFTSADEDSAPLFPYQRRLGGFHLLVHMIANILTSYETTPLRELRKKVARQELDIQSHLEKESAALVEDPQNELPTAEDPQNELHKTEDLIESFEESLSDIAAMKDVVQSQIQILEDLREIFQNSFKFEKGVGKPRNHRNAVKIPFIMDGKEQMRKAVVTMDALIRERRELWAELNVWLRDLRKSRILSSHGNQEVTAKEALKQAKDMQEAITQQGQTISVFTLITTVFVPLSFLTSYFGMSLGESKSPVSSFAGFWAISGPVTLLIMIMMSYFLYGPDDWIKDWIARRFEWVSRVRAGRQKSKDEETPGVPEPGASRPGVSPAKSDYRESSRVSSMSMMGMLEKVAAETT